MNASGKNYTQVQSQIIVPNDKNFTNTSFSIAGVDAKVFVASFTHWKCGGGDVSCSEICFGSAMTLLKALRDNTHLCDHFFSSHFSNARLENAVSNLYHLFLLDPINEQFQSLKGAGTIIVNVPISQNVLSAYYKCFLFTGSYWEENVCSSVNYVHYDSSIVPYLTCRCTKIGILSVFTVNPPTPIHYPPYNEIRLTFYLLLNDKCTKNQLLNFIHNLTLASGLSTQRFVHSKCELLKIPNNDDNETKSVISMTLRPPFSKDQLTNSYAIQAIKRIVSMDNGFTAFDNVKVTNFSDLILYRSLNGDNYARRMTLRIDRSYKEVIGNESTTLATTWIKKMAENMRISNYRFKKPVILIGILFNFTITVPFVGETDDEFVLSAEEIAKWIQEQIRYGELELNDTYNKLLLIEELPNSDIVVLRIVKSMNILMITLALTISIMFIILSGCVSGLVFVKVRTDRLIEAHNANMRTIDITEMMPINVFTSTETTGDATAGSSNRNIDDSGNTVKNQTFFGDNFAQQNHKMIRHRYNNRAQIHDNRAADTVVFNGRPHFISHT